MRRASRNKFNRPLQNQDKHRINQKIRAQEVRVVDGNGEQIGIQPLEQALALAVEQDLDLVEIAPKASPPVCKLIDYGKYKYQLQKEESEAKKNQRDNAVKELKIGYRTDTGDIQTKLKHARSFLSDGNKVKFSMRFRGRERAFVHLGKDKLEQIVGQLSDVAKVYEQNFRSRSLMYITIAPE
ncbi:translation initiation factor IF-3 [Waterburya agarophytonicola K14]|uniref:Translation initiation factor IF-3 n=1 Tax=Waterburya agarophytonicola KI4 TaxID=2874699 RepID=A0A964BMN1_9CYAN|nr:translation initiation factor IF-3 [Waterburya agarophytonicola]MCC0176130.1 translation initiation factor IF-3 [Waterburya agarophytonicola KI4]